MFETWKEFILNFNRNGQEDSSCESCRAEDFDLLCKEKDEGDDSSAAIFICKNCGVQKKVTYTDSETR